MSFTLDSDVLSFVRRTRGRRSASARANELMRRAMVEEVSARIEREAAEFFKDVPAEHIRESRAFFKLAKRTQRRG